MTHMAGYIPSRIILEILLPTSMITLIDPPQYHRLTVVNLLHLYGWETPTSTPKPARYSVVKTGNDGSQSKSWYDKLGREIRSDVKGFAGTMIYNLTNYNIKGQVDSISDPYFSSGTALWNRFIYDNYGRKINLYTPSGRNSAWVYTNNVIAETTAGKTFTKTYSSDGTLVFLAGCRWNNQLYVLSGWKS